MTSGQIITIIVILIAIVIIIWLILPYLISPTCLPDNVRMTAYYLSYGQLMLTGSDVPTSYQTRYGFVVTGTERSSTLLKCLTLSGDYEPSLADWLTRQIEPDDIVVDVGANEGFFTLLAASRHAHVYAVEPSAKNRSLLEANVEANHYQNRVTILPYAAGENNRIVRFNENLFNGMWSSIGEGRTNFVSSSVEVEMRKIEDLLPDSQIPHLVKIDVEGYESKVIEGMMSWVTAGRTIWVIELDDNTPSGQNLISLFEQYDYTVMTLIVDSACLPGRKYQPKSYDSKVGFRNFIFLPLEEICLSAKEATFSQRLVELCKYRVRK